VSSHPDRWEGQMVLSLFTVTIFPHHTLVPAHHPVLVWLV
jgi:hypothetical protein